jgi:phage shock protein A
MNLKETIANRKSKFFSLSGNTHIKAEETDNHKKMLETSLTSMKEKLEEMKQTIESLKGNKKPQKEESKKIEDSKTFLASEKLAITKKVTNTEKSSKRSS